MNRDQIERFIGSMQGIMLGMQQIDSSCMEAFGSISKRDFGLCVMLGSQQNMIMKEVAKFLQVPMSTATGIVDKLIERGLVRRFHSPEDRRVVIIGLSEEGAAIYKMLNGKLFDFGKIILENFEPEEREKYIRYMEKASTLFENSESFEEIMETSS